MTEITLSGKQNFMGKEIPIMYGGFGDGQKCISDKTIAEIHGVTTSDIRKAINRNITRFKENVAFIDLKSSSPNDDLILSLGYSKQQIIQAEHIYILSERGYAKLIKIMDTDLAWEVHDKLIDEYFAMREIINSDEQLKAKLLLSIYKGGQESILAAKGLTEIEVKKATAPLILENEELKPKAEYHDNVLNNKELITTTVIAKDLGLKSAAQLNKILCQNKIIFRDKSRMWHPYAKYEWLITEHYADYKSYEDERTKPCLKWTEKGRKWIVENFEEWRKACECA